MKKRYMSLVGALFVLSAMRVEATPPPEPDAYLSCYQSGLPACFGGRVMKQGAVSGQQPGANFSVRLCKTSPFWSCQTGYADAGGYFLFSNGIQGGQYYLFAWRDDLHWGSYGDNGKVYNMPSNCGGAFNPCKLDAQLQPIVSYPRPLPPVFTMTAACAGFNYANLGYFEWLQPSQPDREIPGSVIKYDFYEDDSPSLNMAAQTNLTFRDTEHALPDHQGGSNSVEYRYVRVEAKMTYPGWSGISEQVTSSDTVQYEYWSGCSWIGPGHGGGGQPQ